jgi:AcrR family transcriptional regulator
MFTIMISMGIRERKKRNAEKMRKNILCAAMDLFSQGGYENVSMRGIAKKIEYSPGAIYRYFENKEDIMRQLCYQGFEQMLSFQEKIDDISNPLERMIEGCRCYIAFATQNQDMYELMFSTGQLEKAAREKEDSVALKSFQKLTDHVRECMTAGIFKGKDAETLAVALWASIHGLSSLLINQQLGFVSEENLHQLIEECLFFFLRESGNTQKVPMKQGN